MAITQSLSGVMRGAGDTMTPMWISLITTVVVRVPLAYGIADFTGRQECIHISLLCSWLIGAGNYIDFLQAWQMEKESDFLKKESCSEGFSRKEFQLSFLK